MTGLHAVSFLGVCYFFRYRRINLASAFVVSLVYHRYFAMTNSILYKVIVDNKVSNVAKYMGYDHLIQPHGKLRKLDY